MTIPNRTDPSMPGRNAIYEEEKNPLDLIDQLEPGMVIVDASTGTLLKANNRIRDLLGYTADEFSQLNFDSIVHPDDMHKNFENLRGMFSSGIQNFSLEKRYIKKCGDPVWFHITVTTLWDAGEPPTSFVATFKEITEARQIEESLKQSEENLRGFFNSVTELLFILDEDGRILLSNETASNRLGYPAAELRGMSVLDLHPPDRREEAGRIVAGMLAGKIESCPVPVITKSGQIIPVETRVCKGKWSGKSVLFGTTKDISELKESEEMFSGVFNINPIPMAITTRDARFINVNDAFLKTLGYSREEIIGQSSIDLRIFDDIQQRESVVQLLKCEGRVRNKLVNIRTKSGALRTGEFSAMYLRLQGHICVLTVMIDVTEKKQFEETLKYQITHDMLTGLYNRQYYEIELERLQHSRQFPISIMVMDVDDLKWVNDHNGHSAGDELLQRAGAILKMAFRPEDVVARLGGDEFVVVLPETSEIAIKDVKERLEKILRNHNEMFAHDKHLGISIGYSTGQSQDNLGEVFKRADQVMYLNKSNRKKSRRKDSENQSVQDKLL